jgi:hypothetical protein
MDPPPLPRPKTYTWDGASLQCPWCESYAVDAAVFTLEALFLAHHDGALHEVEREFTGAAPPGALTVDCPSCSRPSMIVLTMAPGWMPELTIAPVRTAADVAFLSRRAL